MEINLESPEIIELRKAPIPVSDDPEIKVSFADLELGVYEALKTYSNVHRGSGHFSLATTHLFEQARKIVLEYLELKENRFTVVFCSPRSAKLLESRLKSVFYKSISGSDIGLSLGVCAIAVQKNRLSAAVPFHSGGGTARLISKEWVVWAKGPGKFEAGTPAIINIIAFAKALKQIKLSGKEIFFYSKVKTQSATEILFNDELQEFSGSELLQRLRKSWIGSSVSVPTREGIRPFINLDNSASTSTFIPVWNAFRYSLLQPESVKKEIIQHVRSVCAEMLNAPLTEYDVIFTSNTTEAINLAAESLAKSPVDNTKPVVLNSLLEHSSNELPWRMIPECALVRLSVDRNGFIDLIKLKDLLVSYNSENNHGNQRIRLVAISGASNVLGVCNNLAEISSIVHKYGAQMLVDAAQLVAHRKIDVSSCGIDYLAFSAHKVYAPFGTGVLLARKGLLNFNSEELELIRSSGEENAAGIAALGKALVILNRVGMNLIEAEEQFLTSRILQGISQINTLEIYGISDPESPEFADKLGVIPFNSKSTMATKLGNDLALYGGIGVRTGCHCAHIIIKHMLGVGPSLERFQRLIVTLFPGVQLPGVVRVSLGIQNTKEDVDALIQVLTEISNQKNNKKELNDRSKSNGKSILTKSEVKKQINGLVRDVSEKVYG